MDALGKNTRLSDVMPLSSVLHWIFFACLVLMLAACRPAATPEDTSIVFVTRNSPTTYYETLYGPTGFEYDLAAAYAEYVGRPLKIIERDSVDAVLNELAGGQAHIAAAGLSSTSDRSRLYHFSPPYMQVSQYVLYRYGSLRPRSVNALADKKLRVLRGTSHELTLNELSATQADLSWDFSPTNSVLALMTELRNGDIDHIIVDSNDYDLYKSTFPSLGIAFTIKRGDHLVWMLGAMQGNQLLASVDSFFSEIRENGELEALVERHYGHISHMGRNDSRTFAKRVASRLPSLEQLIKQVAHDEDFDWRLLAAISYQESHWNPRAKSPTGVRGLMMLTKITAKEMGVTNRVDAEQSLRGGARYYRKIHNRLPQQIFEPDRSWMALAAYNVGLGHLEDARVLTQKTGGNPDLWMDVMERLPLLRERKYYSQTRYGYARGDEPVTYVQRIRNYYMQLSWRDRNEQIMLAMASSPVHQP